jgi:hypothetical protein
LRPARGIGASMAQLPALRVIRGGIRCPDAENVTTLATVLARVCLENLPEKFGSAADLRQSFAIESASS